MVVGIVDHQAGTAGHPPPPPPGTGLAADGGGDARRRRRRWPGSRCCSGSWPRRTRSPASSRGRSPMPGLVLTPVVLASMLTVAYSLRFAWGALGFAAAGCGTRRRPRAGGRRRPGSWLPAARCSPRSPWCSAWCPRSSTAWSGRGRAAARPRRSSRCTWRSGTASGCPSCCRSSCWRAASLLFLARRPVARVLALGHRVPSGGAGLPGVLRGLNVVADRVTAVVQSGSLPVYAGVILATAALLTTGALVLGDGWPGWPAVVGSRRPRGGVRRRAGRRALAAAAVHRRFSAALLLGATGYAMAGLFVVQGGADLALTQVAIETLTTVLFVLVLRRLPDRFESRAPAPAGRAATVAAARGRDGVRAGHDRQAGAAPPTPVSEEMVERAVPDGGGRNVVNVILVDFRGLDTMGEITVLAAAAIGAVALARAGRGPRRPRSLDGRRHRRATDPAAEDVPAAAPSAAASGGSWCSTSPSALVFIRRDGGLAVPVVRRAQPTRRRVRRAASWPAPPWPCATWPAASTRCAALSRPTRGRCSAPGCCSSAVTAPCRCGRRRAARERQRGRPTSPCSAT